MGRWDTIATDLLAAATGAGVAVERSFIATGPSFAHPCRLIAVHLDSSTEQPMFPEQSSAFGPVASVTRLNYVVTFVAACLPTIDESGEPPPESEITTSATALLADAGQIHDALLDPVFTEPAGITCQDVTLGDGAPFGPLGGRAGWRWPVAVVLT